jgi:hypothetical protein
MTSENDVSARVQRRADDPTRRHEKKNLKKIEFFCFCFAVV